MWQPKRRYNCYYNALAIALGKGGCSRRCLGLSRLHLHVLFLYVIAVPAACRAAVQSPPPYFVGGDVIAMAGWFPGDENLQIAISQFEEEGSTYARDFAVLSLMEAFASDDAKTILQVSARLKVDSFQP